MADQVDYRIEGEDLQSVTIILDPGEGMRAEPGAMLWMEDGIDMDTSTGGGLFSGLKRKIAGESFFITTFTNSAHDRREVTYGGPYPGRIVPLHLGGGVGGAGLGGVHLDHQFGFDGARGEGVGGDAVDRQFRRHDFGQGDDPALGGAIGSTPHATADGGSRRQINDTAIAPLDHFACRRLATIEGPREIDVDETAPFLGRGLQERPLDADSGAVDQDVEASEAGDGLGNHAPGVFGLGDVEGDGNRLGARVP